MPEVARGFAAGSVTRHNHTSPDSYAGRRSRPFSTGLSPRRLGSNFGELLMNRMQGGCQCGQVRYEISAEPVALYACHCRDCQYQSGSAFGMSLIVPGASFHLRGGTLKTFETSTASGRTKHCAFCPECGVRIYNTTGSHKSIKAGTLDERGGLAPQAHYWTGRKQPWVVLPDGVPCFAQDGSGERAPSF